MKTKSALIAGLAMLGVLLLYTLSVYHRLPDLLPIHWNIRGEADGWASKEKAVLLMPGIVVLTLVMMLGLPAISPAKFSIEAFRNTFNYIMLVISAMMGYIHLLMLQTGLHPETNTGKAMIVGMFLFFALMGNMMGKVRRNMWMGWRTPWTLASERVWDATHRLAGKLMVASGILGCLLVMAGVSTAVAFSLFVAALLYPCVFSYFLYRRTEGK